MKKLFIFSLLLVFVFFLYSCGGGGGGSKSESSSSTNSSSNVNTGNSNGNTNSPSPGSNIDNSSNTQNAVKTWTVMIYMDGDNSLNSYTTSDIRELEQVGSTAYMNVVVEVDTLYSTAKRYFIEKNSEKLISDLGEIDMADPQTLVEFARWAISTYPAEHYLLVLWDHGNGIEPVFTRGSVADRDIFEDDNIDIHGFAAAMDIPSLADALNVIKSSLNRKIDVVGFDDCLMNMVEVAYQIKDSSRYMVGSENSEPADGWPYDLVLKEIEKNPHILPKELAVAIVRDYVNSYTSGSLGVTQSAIDLSRMDGLANSIDALSYKLVSVLDDPTVKNLIRTKVFSAVQRYDSNGDNIINDNDSYVDLEDLVVKLEENIPSLRPYVGSVVDNLSLAVVANAYKNGDTNNIVSGSTGLSVWFPSSESLTSFEYHYTSLDFARYTSWLDFLNELWQ